MRPLTRLGTGLTSGDGVGLGLRECAEGPAHRRAGGPSHGIDWGSVYCWPAPRVASGRDGPVAVPTLPLRYRGLFSIQRA